MQTSFRTPASKGNKIQNKENMHQDEQRFGFAGNRADGGRTLSDDNFEKQSNLHTPRLRRTRAVEHPILAYARQTAAESALEAHIPTAAVPVARAVAAKPATAAKESIFSGTIKSFDAERGYGFISCVETHEKYGKDVFMHKKQIRHFRVLDSVCFRVEVSAAGNPQACNLSEGPKLPTLLAVKSDDQDHKGKLLAAEKYVGTVKSINSLKAYGFIECEATQKVCGRDVFFPLSLSDGITVGERVEFQARLKSGQPQAHVMTRIGNTLCVVKSPSGPPHAALTRKLLRACASVRKESYNEMFELLKAGADPNGRDVTGQTALMICTLVSGGGEKKCRLLVGMGADVHAIYQDKLTVLQWVRERLNPTFAAHLEALSRGEQPDCPIVLDVLGGPSEI